MKHHACIAIGINQYQFLQPLSYAQEDAEALHGFLVNEVGFSSDGCLLLTDTSPSMWGNSTYPNRENILKLIESLCSEHLHHGDLLWCFFSGYGVSYEGQDYLMPIDGNPADIPGTAIAVKDLFDSLKGAPTEMLLVLLDMNRSQSVKAGETIGAATEELARQMEIPTILSCRSNQVSRETAALRQGFFSAALLEGLRNGQGTTLKSIERFLNDRLPELCEQHLRPKQEPVMVVTPPGKKNLVVLPDNSQVLAATAAGRNGSMTMGGPTETLNQVPMVATTAQIDPPSSNPVANESKAVTPPPPPIQRKESGSGGSGDANSAVSPPTESTMSDKSFLQQLILWSGATALVLLLGVFLTNRSVFLGRPGGETQPGKGETAQTPKKGGNDPAVSPSQPMVVPQPIVSKADGSQPVSPEMRLDEARMLLRENSASSFSDAIARARKIPANDPMYPQAQEDIERWSATILDIANGRAGRENFQGAINAAKLVPTANKPLYSQAQQAISKWDTLAKQERTNAALLTAAQGQIKRGAASSYSKAIEQASTIPPGQPKYEAAQKSISEWSETIFKIAQLRASQGRFQEAVDAALLVPSGTKTYDSAQKSISGWKTKVTTKKKS